MKKLVCALAFSVFAFVGTAHAHCGACGVGDDAHASEHEKKMCAKCGQEKGTEECAAACAKAEKCSDCGAGQGSDECRKNCAE